jgi:hypothetical protein
MLQKLQFPVVTVFAVLALMVGANEAFGAVNSVRFPNCPSNYNWCAPSQGGIQNCNACCFLFGSESGGLCISQAEMSDQGCLCY